MWKSLTILAAIFICILAINSYYQNNYEYVFHIRVKCFSIKADVAEEQFYVVEFTDDNWLTSKTINETFDLHYDLGKREDGVVYQEAILKQKDAINTAKMFRSYQACIDYNRHIYNKYRLTKIWYKTHPIQTQKKAVNKVLSRACCKTIQIY